MADKKRPQDYGLIPASELGLNEDDFIIDLSDDNRVVISTALLSLKSNLLPNLSANDELQ